MSSTTPPAYVIASPSLRARARGRWDRLLLELAALMPGTELVSWPNLATAFGAVPRPERPVRLARALGGAVVVPDKFHGRRWIGRVAVAEAAAFAAVGKPVHLFADGELIAWTECHLAHGVDGAPVRTPVELVVPGRLR